MLQENSLKLSTSIDLLCIKRIRTFVGLRDTEFVRKMGGGIKQ
jgi:hypothetical protein